MKIKSIFLAISLVIFPSLVLATPQDLKLASAVLDAAKVSYLVAFKANSLHVNTFNYKNPVETCKFLIKNGINVENVTNYTSDSKSGIIVADFKRC